MTVLEALKLVHGWAKEAQRSNDSPQSRQALSMVQKLVDRVEHAEVDSIWAVELAKGVMAEHGYRMVASIDTFNVREKIWERGFEELGGTVWSKTIIEEIDRQIELFGGVPAALNEWTEQIVQATARALVEKAGLVWPADSKKKG